MEIVFPDNKSIDNRGVIRNLDGNQFLPIDISDPTDNLITIDNVDYCFTYLNPSGKAKGGNSIILKLFNAQEVLNEWIYEEPDLILKILKFPKSRATPRKAEQRFTEEINALLACRKKNFQNVISIFHHGVCKIKKNGSREKFSFDYYTMEYAEYDLKDYIESKHSELEIDQKIALCLSLAEGIRELYSLGYYHRDIKPDNIFFAGDNWKIGDLGLLVERGKEEEIDDDNEFIGPRGWLSPEAINKFLCYKKGFKIHHECNIDHQSDIFQLGKVFCYIIQHNNPMGVFKEKEMFLYNSELYQVIRTMLNYSKKRRYNDINEVITSLKRIQLKFLKR